MKARVLAALLTCVLLGAAATLAFGGQAVATPADSLANATATQSDSTLKPPAAPVAAPPPTPPPTQAAPPPATPAPAATPQQNPESRVYYGGTVTLSFGNVMRIGVYPMIGYKLTPKLSGGAEVGYEYVDYDDYNQSASNYGGSVFGRFRLSPQLYAHAEYQTVNYEIFTGPNTSTREWVPFLLVGGGLTKHVGPRTSAYVEVLFDVLQDDKSPYDEWDPVVSVGVSVGF